MKAQLIRKVSLVALLGFAAFAATATEWTYYAKGAEDSPYSTAACITDGNWVLKAGLSTVTKVLTLPGNKCYVSGSGVLDLRQPTINGVVYSLQLGDNNAPNGAFLGTADITEFYADTLSTVKGTYQFRNCTSLTKAELSGTLTAMSNQFFDGCTALTTVVLNLPGLTDIGSPAVFPSVLQTLAITTDNAVGVAADCVLPNLKSLTINGPAWETAELDKLLCKVTATTADKNCTLYANKDTWSSLASAVTDAETAVKPKKCFGVYREGSRKAWLVANNVDPVPFRIIIR